jgi:magnesium-protoporphyrin IX monomethyl ester (oxidative) cyclase
LIHCRNVENYLLAIGGIQSIMVSTLNKPEFDEIRPGVKAPAKDTILTPRFYTTDFEEMAQMDMAINEEEFRALVEELRVDYNRHHFVRGAEFDQSWDNIDPDTRRLFVEFLERSCTAEFSGFLLYKEMSRRLKTSNPLLAEGFALMSRDEARHAGFLNKSLSDFNLSLDLGFLTSSKKYTYFKPKFILYATYLSEKIGYWRYITIYRHLEQNPERHNIYPIFRFFENWCQDENRHGDFFDAIMRAQPQHLTGLRARLWCRFFLLSVLATMYLNDIQRTGFYESLGLVTRDFEREVIEKTNTAAGKVFPIILDVQHPKFYQRLERCVSNNEKLGVIASSNAAAPIKLARKLPLYLSNAKNLLSLYFVKPIEMEASHGMVR